MNFRNALRQNFDWASTVSNRKETKLNCITTGLTTFLNADVHTNNSRSASKFNYKEWHAKFTNDQVLIDTIDEACEYEINLNLHKIEERRGKLNSRLDREFINNREWSLDELNSDIAKSNCLKQRLEFKKNEYECTDKFPHFCNSEIERRCSKEIEIRASMNRYLDKWKSAILQKLKTQLKSKPKTNCTTLSSDLTRKEIRRYLSTNHTISSYYIDAAFLKYWPHDFCTEIDTNRK